MTCNLDAGILRRAVEDEKLGAVVGALSVRQRRGRALLLEETDLRYHDEKLGTTAATKRFICLASSRLG